MQHLRFLTRQALLVALLASVACSVPAQPGPRGGVVPVQPIRGQYCVAFGPPGYAVAAESAQRIGFGADIIRRDGRAGAGFSVMGGGPIVGLSSLASPEIALATVLSSSGQLPLRWGRSVPLEAGLMAREFQTSIGRGVAYYRVFPQQGGFVIVVRSAQSAPEMWARDGPELIALALSVRCRVPMVPAASDPPPKPRAPRGRGGEGDSQYNWILGKETYHDPATGQNYWVSPSTDYSSTGPQGGGYYVRRGNESVLLQPGYSP